ncbi:uncharacterized protein BJX67DRAFT_67902 [Aspergillus lucknowensis]|uniref:Uncharacterized protein n=1 Tax=Aspergillus lucknowensis TaxID=176173 RepID=A0ABR4LTL2_9EURO
MSAVPLPIIVYMPRGVHIIRTVPIRILEFTDTVQTRCPDLIMYGQCGLILKPVLLWPPSGKLAVSDKEYHVTPYIHSRGNARKFHPNPTHPKHANMIPGSHRLPPSKVDELFEVDNNFSLLFYHLFQPQSNYDFPTWSGVRFSMTCEKKKCWHENYVHTILEYVGGPITRMVICFTPVRQVLPACLGLVIGS